MAVSSAPRRAGVPRWLGPWLRQCVTNDVLVGMALALLWTLAHAFVGIEHDSRLYMGRALADLDPAGVGQDIMFQMDGQSSFSLYRIVARIAVARLGLGPAVLALSLLNLCAWFVALVMFARTLVPGRAIVLALAATCVLSMGYAPWGLIGAGESIPIPRPLAEAGVLLAMTALCRARMVECVAWLVLATLVHPIMAAPGFGILLAVLCWRDRRWIVATLAGAALLVGTAAFGPLFAGRLTATIDPAWKAILIERNPYLFVGLWPRDVAISTLIVRLVTIGFACLWLGGTTRVVVVAAAGVGVLGIVASYGLGDLAGNLLVVQAQLWRALWLPAVLAPLAAGLCLSRLSRGSPIDQIVLAFLTLAWLNLDTAPMGPACALLALGIHVGAPRLRFTPDRRAVIGAWLLCAAAAASTQWIAVSALTGLWRSLPPGVALDWALAWPLQVATLPAMALAFAWWRWPDRPASRIGLAAFIALGLVLVATQWDSRTLAKADLDTATHRPDLVAMLASRPGPVLWTEGDDAWYWLGRPNWNAQIQGSSIVFSRALTMEWRARAADVVMAGLATPYLLRPLSNVPPPTAPRLDPAKIIAFCRGFDDMAGKGPAWIVTPMDLGAALPPGLDGRIWVAPHPRWKLVTDGDGLHWRPIDRFAVLPCSKV